MIGNFGIHAPKGGEDAEEDEKMALVAKKTEEKGKLVMDPMVESSWPSKEYSAPIEESVLLFGKSAGMLGTTQGVLHSRLLGLVR